MKKALSIFKLEIATFFKSITIAVFSFCFLFAAIGVTSAFSCALPLSYNQSPTEFSSVEGEYYSQMETYYFQYQTAIGETPEIPSEGGPYTYGNPNQADEYYQKYLYYKYLYDNHLVIGQDILIVSQGNNPLENWLSMNKDTIGTNNKFSLFAYNLTNYSSYLLVGISIVITAYLFSNKKKDDFSKNILMSKDMSTKDITKGRLMFLAFANLITTVLFIITMILIMMPNIGKTALVIAFNQAIAVPFVLITIGSFIGFFVLSMFVDLFIILLMKIIKQKRWSYIIVLSIYALSFVLYKACSASIYGFDNSFSLSFFPLLNLQFAINSVVNPIFYCLIIVYVVLIIIITRLIFAKKEKQILL